MSSAKVSLIPDKIEVKLAEIKNLIKELREEEEMGTESPSGETIGEMR